MLLLLVKVWWMFPPNPRPPPLKVKDVVVLRKENKDIGKNVVVLRAALTVSRRRRTSRNVATFGKGKKTCTPHDHLFQRGSMWLVKTKRIIGSFGYVIAKQSRFLLCCGNLAEAPLLIRLLSSGLPRQTKITFSSQ